MASPDLTGYVDLTLYDRTPAELVERALLDAGAKLPEWVPRDGNTEVVLTESLSLVVAELVYAVNRTPGAIAEVLLRLFDVNRSLGVEPTAEVTFTLSDDLGHELPAGTTVRLELAGGTFLDFTTDAGAVAAAGVLAITAPATAVTATAAANGTPAGTALELVSAVPYVDAVALASDVAAGADEEDEAAWRDRGVQTFARLTSTLVLPEHFTAEALTNPLVYRAQTVDNLDPAGGPAGSDPGHVTVAVLGSGGAFLAAGDKDALLTDLDSKALANLVVHVVDPTVTAVDVDVTVAALPGFTAAQVTDNVRAVLEAYLSPDTWEWGGVVRRNELIARIDGAVGVDYVDTLTTPAADVVLAGTAPLTDLGLLAVAVL